MGGSESGSVIVVVVWTKTKASSALRELFNSLSSRAWANLRPLTISAQQIDDFTPIILSNHHHTMSLSVGTLNLKFMQRAAAAKVRDESASTGSPAPAPAAPPPLPKGTDQAEEDAKWFLPSRRAAPAAQAASTSTAGAGPSRPRVNFVASYLPFVADEAPGRRAFGGFGEKPKEEEEAEDSDEEGVDSEDEVVEVKKAKGKRKDDVRS